MQLLQKQALTKEKGADGRIPLQGALLFRLRVPYLLRVLPTEEREVEKAIVARPNHLTRISEPAKLFVGIGKMFKWLLIIEKIGNGTT